MPRMHFPEDSPASEPATVNSLEAIRVLRSAGGALLAQAVLHGQLARVEWAEEKIRLLKMIAVTLLGFACLLCVMLSAGVLVLAFCWETALRVPSVIALIAIYTLGTRIAWHRFQALSAQSDQSFAATRAELAADIALLKSKL